jgi:hypothetical protein
MYMYIYILQIYTGMRTLSIMYRNMRVFLHGYQYYIIIGYMPSLFSLRKAYIIYGILKVFMLQLHCSCLLQFCEDRQEWLFIVIYLIMLL